MKRRFLSGSAKRKKMENMENCRKKLSLAMGKFIGQNKNSVIACPSIDHLVPTINGESLNKDEMSSEIEAENELRNISDQNDALAEMENNAKTEKNGESRDAFSFFDETLSKDKVSFKNALENLNDRNEATPAELKISGIQEKDEKGDEITQNELTPEEIEQVHFEKLNLQLQNNVSNSGHVINETVSEEGKWSYDDPAKWPPITETLREHFVHYKPNQNIDKLESSKRMIGKKERLCSENNFSRTKRNGEKVKRDWLIYSQSSQSVFCYICKLYSSSEQALCKDGFSDWKNICKRLESHENSTFHRSSVFSFSQRCLSSRRIDNNLVQQFKADCDYWRKILHRVVAVIKFIALRGLPFFGENETLNSVHNGNFLGILELLSTFDPCLAAHLKIHGNKGKGHANYLSSTTVSELIDVMSGKVLREIVTDIQDAKYFGLILDSTPDICHIDQLAVIIRYVNREGEPVERFLKFLPIHSHNAQHLYDVVTDLMKELEINLKFCRGQSYDNASNMAGKYSGLQARLKSDFPLIEYVPCSAHSLNLVGVNAVECCHTAVSFFGLVQSLYNFFSASTHRWELLHNRLQKEMGTLTLKSLSGTRWSANADAVKALRKGFILITEILHNISEDSMETASTRHEANSLFLKLNTFETAVMIVIWDVILQRMNSVNNTLQSVNCIMASVVPLYESLEHFITTVRNEFDIYENEATKLVYDKKYATTRKRKIPKSRMLDEIETADVQVEFSGKERFLYQTHYVICDSILAHLSRRKSAYSFLESRFGFMYSRDLSTSAISKAAKNFQEVYFEDIEEEFPDEFLQFHNFLPQDQKITESLKTIKSLNIMHTFPNVEIGLRILNSIPISNCSSERSFSALKRIKNRFRSNLSENKLVGLALLAIENDMTESLTFDDVIEEFATRKARKKPMSKV